MSVLSCEYAAECKVMHITAAMNMFVFIVLD